MTLADHRVAEAFDGALPDLQGLEVTPAVVYVSQEKELAEELSASGHASIRLYLDGDRNNPEVCPGTCGVEVPGRVRARSIGWLISLVCLR